MERRTRIRWPGNAFRAHEVPTWTNALVSDDMPIAWNTADADPYECGEPAGRLVFGKNERITIDLCGTAASRLLTILICAHLQADIPLPPEPKSADVPFA